MLRHLSAARALTLQLPRRWRPSSTCRQGCRSASLRRLFGASPNSPTCEPHTASLNAICAPRCSRRVTCISRSSQGHAHEGAAGAPSLYSPQGVQGADSPARGAEAGGRHGYDRVQHAAVGGAVFLRRWRRLASRGENSRQASPCGERYLPEQSVRIVHGILRALARVSRLSGGWHRCPAARGGLRLRCAYFLLFPASAGTMLQACLSPVVSAEAQQVASLLRLARSA